MDSISKRENLLRDSVHLLLKNAMPGVGATLIGAAVVVLVVMNEVPPLHLALWGAGMVLTGLARLVIYYFYLKKEKNGTTIRRFRALTLSALTATGIVWGSTAFWPFPMDLLSYQVFVTFVLAGMVAGSVGIYSVMKSAFFLFSIPTLFPMAMKFILEGGEIFYAMAIMLLLFWAIMLITSLKLNRDINGYVLIKYDNLSLISDLEAEMKVRKATEDDLKKKNLEIEKIVDRRTEELLESNKKLIREIEERRQIAEALEENEEKFREMVESINDVIFAVNEKGVITYMSPVAGTVLGYSPKEMLGKDLKPYVHPDDLDMLSAILPQRKAGDIRSNEYRLRTRASGYLWIRSSSRAVFKDGGFAGVRGVLTDISEKRKLEEQLRRTHKMDAVATLSGGIAHDFNNLLAVILGNTELAMMDQGSSPSVHVHLEKIVESSLRAKEIVKELLSFASRRKDAARCFVNVAGAVLQEVEHLESSLPGAVVLEKEVDPSSGTILGDETQIRQVMANIWDNAIEAMADGGGTLAVIVKRVVLSPGEIDFDSEMGPGNYILLSVRDTGVGIQPEHLGRLFDPYYTTKQFGQGDGFGLAVVHGITKWHCGGIRVSSTPGEGSRFDLFFPEAT
jgi:PAS domain S-box-containing protein